MKKLLFLSIIILCTKATQANYDPSRPLDEQFEKLKSKYANKINEYNNSSYRRIDPQNPNAPHRNTTYYKSLQDECIKEQWEMHSNFLLGIAVFLTAYYSIKG